MKANNIYDRSSVKRSDKGSKRANQEENTNKRHKISTDHSASAKSTNREHPYPDQDHRGFQFNTNPMYEDSFEKRLLENEKLERDMATERYIAGIQGRDGGKKPFECENINN